MTPLDRALLTANLRLISVSASLAAGAIEGGSHRDDVFIFEQMTCVRTSLADVERLLAKEKKP